MPIFTGYGKSILFQHIPKCGGSTIEGFFKRNQFDVDWLTHGLNKGYLVKNFKCSLQHWDWNLLSNCVRVDSFDYKFAIVRNPLDRMVSEFQMRHKNKSNIDFNKWVLRIFSEYNSNNYVLDNHIRPQTEFVGDDVDVFKLENGLNKNFISILSSKIGFPLKGVTVRSNISYPHPSINFKSSISLDTLNAIEKFYHLDYERFSY